MVLLELSFVFGAIFKQSINNFLPYLTVSLVLWGFISNSINEGCASFSSSSDIILQVRFDNVRANLNNGIIPNYEAVKAA